MAIGTTIRVGFDSTRVQAGFRKIGAGFTRMTNGFKMAGRAMLAPFIKLMAVMAPILGAVGFARGIKDVVDFGGAISDLSARTGEAASEILVMQEAFRRTGVDGDKVATILQKMGRRSLDGVTKGSGEYADALDNLNLRSQDLMNLGLADRFQLIGKRIRGLRDESMQADVAMKLFGLDGFKLVNTFKDGSAFEVARKSVGGLADTMNRAAVRFDAVSDALGAIGLKTRQFFAGVAEMMLPSLERLADYINGLDLSKIGAQVGKVAQTITRMLEAGTLGQTVWESLKFAGVKFVEFMAGSMGYIVQELLEQLSKTSFGKKLGIKSATEASTEFTPTILPGGIGAIPGFTTSTPTGLKSFADFQRENKGILGSTSLANSIGQKYKQAGDTESVEWWRKIGYSNEEIAETLRLIANRQRTSKSQPYFQ